MVLDTSKSSLGLDKSKYEDPAKPSEQVYHIHPLGWESDPEEERFKISTLDYLSVVTYMNWALFFKLEDDESKPKAVEVLRAGLERTLSQVRHLCGTIERDSDGGHSFVKKKDSTVQLVVQWLDKPEDAGKYSSMHDMEKAHFTTASLGDLNLWSVSPALTYGEKPESHPDASPMVSAYKANFVRGGLVLNMHVHHYAQDLKGWAGFARQLAENCYAIVNGTPFPGWDPACLDRSRLTKPQVPPKQQVEGPPPRQRHPDHTRGASLLFHLPKSKAAELKKLATPSRADNPPVSFVSTWDAVSAFFWRSVTRVRAPVFQPDPSSHLLWAEAVDLRSRFHGLGLPERMACNGFFAAVSTINAPAAGIAEPTVADIISDWPMWRLAAFVRQMTDSVTEAGLDAVLDSVAPIRDKTTLNVRVDSFPPMTVGMTDWRMASMAGVDFGFGKAALFRHLQDRITTNANFVYPPRDESAESDEGIEIVLFYEKRLMQTLIEDGEFNRYFEFRGVDCVDGYDEDP